MDLFAVSGNRSPCKAGEGAEGWTSPLVTGSILVGFVSLVLFALRRSFMRKPVMDLRVFRDPMYITGLLLVLSCIMIILSSMIILPMFLQNGMGLSVFTAGRMLLPGSALNGILSPRMGRLFDKYRPKCLVIPGLIVVAVVLWFFSGISSASSFNVLRSIRYIKFLIGSPASPFFRLRLKIFFARGCI